VEDFDNIVRDQVLCASSGRRFIPPQESQQMVEVKANWGRMNRKYGRHSTDIIVETRRSYTVEVRSITLSHLLLLGKSLF